MTTAPSAEAGPGFALRPATAADLGSVRALATQVFLDTYATEGIRPSIAREVDQQFALAALQAWLDRPGCLLVVAEQAGHLIAFAQLERGAGHALVADAETAELARLYVQPRFQGRGVGSRLLAWAEARARDEGAATLWLTAWIGNVRALSFYRRCGYRELGATSYEFEGERYENRLFAKALGAAGKPPNAPSAAHLYFDATRRSEQ